MKVSTMRSIDRWVGIPACLIISPFRWLADLLRGAKKTPPDTRRTLFIELSEMGSAVIADPAMRKLKAAGNAGIYFAIFRKNYKSLEILKTVKEEQIFKMNADNFPGLVLDVFRFMAWCRRNKISTVIDLELFSRFTGLLSFLSGARSRIGFTNYHDEGLYRGHIVNRPVRYNPHVHIGVNFMALVNKALHQFELPYATTPVLPEELQLAKATVSPGEISRMTEKIRQLAPAWNNEKIVLLNVNASDMLPQRRWPPENFAAVATGLLRQHNDIILLATGAPAERAYVEAVVREVNHPHCINTAGFFAFEELVPLYTLSTCMLTNDSGPAHFAAVTPLKVFVLFGPETPNLYLPLGGNAEPFYLGLPCSPCVSAANHRKTSCEARPCITGIQPLTVLNRLSEFLQREKAATTA